MRDRFVGKCLTCKIAKSTIFFTRGVYAPWWACVWILYMGHATRDMESIFLVVNRFFKMTSFIP